MYGEHYRVSIECLENGFAVEVPDMEARAKKLAEEKKRMKAKGGDMSCCPSPYYGDCTKKFAAKTTKEVLALVKSSLEKMPENEYDSAFNEAASK